MSFDKDYPNRKDKRSPYYDSRNFDRTCRNHGTCPSCQGKHKYKIKRILPISEQSWTNNE